MIGLELLRKRLNYSGDTFGKMYNVTRATISIWENSGHIPPQKRKMISTDFKISESFLEADANENKEFITLQAQNYLKQKEDLRISPDLRYTLDEALSSAPTILFNTGSDSSTNQDSDFARDILLAVYELYQKGSYSKKGFSDSDQDSIELVCTILKQRVDRHNKRMSTLKKK